MIHFPVNITQHPSSQAVPLTHKHFNQRGANCKPVPAGGNVHYYHHPAASGSIQPICTLPPGACRSMLQASSHRVMITGCNCTWWGNSKHKFPPNKHALNVQYTIGERIEMLLIFILLSALDIAWSAGRPGKTKRHAQ